METSSIVLSFLILCLLVTNGLTLTWALVKRRPKNNKVDDLAKAISNFENNGQSILRIERINPDNVFLKSPGRG